MAGISPRSTLAFVQQRRALRRHIEADVELIGIRIETVDQRLRIQIRNRAKAEWGHVSRSRSIARKAGRGDVAPHVFNRRPAASPASDRQPVDTRSRSLAPNVSATCASLGPYCAQSTWMFFTDGSASRASATARTSS